MENEVKEFKLKGIQGAYMPGMNQKKMIDMHVGVEHVTDHSKALKAAEIKANNAKLAAKKKKEAALAAKLKAGKK